MKILKILLYIIGAIGVLVTLAVVGFAIMVKGCVEELANSATEVKGQVTTETAGNLMVQVPLIEEDVVVLEGVSWCEVKGEPRSRKDYGYWSWCTNDKCRTILTFKEGKSIPESMTIHRKHEGECISEKISNLRDYEVTHYEAEISLPAIKNGQEKKDRAEKTAKSKYLQADYVSWGDKAKVTLKYESQHPGTSDEFRFQDKLVEVSFTSSRSD